MIGSMGLASAIGLGFSLAARDTAPVVLDGDGNLLMNLGILPLVAALHPRRFVHIVFDNEVYGSTGSQRSITSEIRLDRLAEAAGYDTVAAVTDADAITQAVQTALDRDGSHFILAKVTAEAAATPVLLDGDTGYGNFNNMRRLVRKLEQVGVAGVVIEDKLFPKTNSFLRSELQSLADIAEFCGKIKAGKDSQQDADFVLVARVEALIAGWGLPEALKRAEAYHAAGADAILIHSRQSSPAEIFAFLAEWGNRSPVVLVPTTYWRTSTEDFRARRGSMVIWANHLLRAPISAMQERARRPRAG